MIRSLGLVSRAYHIRASGVITYGHLDITCYWLSQSELPWQVLELPALHPFGDFAVGV